MTLTNCTPGANASFYYKRGNVVTLFIDCTPTSATRLTVFTLPQGFRPPADIRYGLIPLVHDNNNMATAYAVINASGAIELYQGAIKRVFFTATFSVA